MANKTIKDFKIDVADGNCHEEDWFTALDYDGVRNEAIKRVKIFEENMLKNKGCQPGTLGWLRNEELKSNIALFNDFFDVTEKDIEAYTLEDKNEKY